nr:hypothetical protein OG999_04985 [Streptomyces sp. NBC_00886]
MRSGVFEADAAGLGTARSVAPAPCYVRPSIEIARRIGVPWVEFPGIHTEFLRSPARFAVAVRVLATRMRSREGDVPELWEGAAQ